MLDAQATRQLIWILCALPVAVAGPFVAASARLRADEHYPADRLAPGRAVWILPLFLSGVGPMAGLLALGFGAPYTPSGLLASICISFFFMAIGGVTILVRARRAAGRHE
ncbi:MAG: hypothetical protein ACYC5F_10985 [Thermoleophilia bacterium]